VIFPKWTNNLPLVLVVLAGLAGAGVAAGVTNLSHAQVLPCRLPAGAAGAFSHRIHAGQLGLDCRYCHNGVENPGSRTSRRVTCMNCHSLVLKDDPRLQIVRDSAASNTPIAWVQVHHVPDYVYSTIRFMSRAASVAWPATAGGPDGGGVPR